MPLSSFDHPLIGYAVFSAIKFAGYAAFGSRASRLFGCDVSPAMFGAVRTLVGMTVGTTFWLSLLVLHLPGSPLEYYGVLLLLRLAEWTGVFWLFFRTAPSYKSQLPRVVCEGCIVSFLLDLPAGFGLLATGGVPVC